MSRNQVHEFTQGNIQCARARAVSINETCFSLFSLIRNPQMPSLASKKGWLPPLEIIQRNETAIFTSSQSYHILPKNDKCLLTLRNRMMSSEVRFVSCRRQIRDRYYLSFPCFHSLQAIGSVPQPRNHGQCPSVKIPLVKTRYVPMQVRREISRRHWHHNYSRNPDPDV